MNSATDRKSQSRGGARTWAKWAALLVVGLILAGCDDRISLEEFIEMQRVEAGEEAPQPTTAEGADTALVDRQLGPYRVGPEDVLAVSVTAVAAEGQGAAVPAVRVRVHSDGAVELPLAGKVKVSEMTLEEVEAAVQQAYVPKYHRQATVHVQLLEAASTNVLVVGAVTTPGLVALRRTERNLLFAMARAGGASMAASGLVTLQPIHRPGAPATMNLRDPEALRAALALQPLEDGDIVMVHAAKPNTVFVGGLVNGAGPQSYPPDTQVTILQALAAAGGVREDLLPREATLIRRVKGTDVHVKLNLSRLAKGKDENIALAAGDILWVPHTLSTRINDFINRNVYLRAGASATYGAYYSDHGAQYYGDLKRRDTGVIVGPGGG